MGFAIVFLAFRNVYTILNAKGFQKNRLRGGQVKVDKYSIALVYTILLELLNERGDRYEEAMYFRYYIFDYDNYIGNRIYYFYILPKK